jgi:phosphinothricin acetyltransferase
MNPVVRKALKKDTRAILDIYNYFIENSYAAYSDTPNGKGYVKRVFEQTKRYPFYVAEVEGKVVGYGFARPFNALSSCRKSSLLTYFILPEYTGKGIGGKIFDRITDDLKRIEVDNLIVNISSLNEQSLNFHRKMGFVECGCFKCVGVKHSKNFDMIWMQKFV